LAERLKERTSRGIEKLAQDPIVFKSSNVPANGPQRLAQWSEMEQILVKCGNMKSRKIT